MFIILVYDVAAKRDHKVKKICERYLLHIQNSVFEGSITEAKLKRLKKEMEKAMDTETDQCTIYKLESLKYTTKEEIGLVKQPDMIL